MKNIMFKNYLHQKIFLEVKQILIKKSVVAVNDHSKKDQSKKDHSKKEKNIDFGPFNENFAKLQKWVAEDLKTQNSRKRLSDTKRQSQSIERMEFDRLGINSDENFITEINERRKDLK